MIDIIDDLNEVEQDVLEEIDPDLVSYTFSTRGGSFVKIVILILNVEYQCNQMYFINNEGLLPPKPRIRGLKI